MMKKVFFIFTIACLLMTGKAYAYSAIDPTDKPYTEGEFTDVVDLLILPYQGSRWDLSLNNNLSVTEVFLAAEHGAAGVHTSVTADNVDVAGNLTVDGKTWMYGSGTTNALQVANTGTANGVYIAQSGAGNGLFVENDSTQFGMYYKQDGELAAGKNALGVYSNTAQVNYGSALVMIKLDNASSTEPCLELIQDGSGLALETDGDAEIANITSSGNIEAATYGSDNSVTNAELLYLDATSSIQTQLDSKLGNGSSPTVADLTATGNVEAATYGSDDSVSDAELLYINSLSSNAQTQISAKEGTLTNEAGLYSALSDVTEFLETSDAATLVTLDTGYGANELYDMDQHVLEASDVTFDDLSLTSNLEVGGGITDAADKIFATTTKSITFTVTDPLDLTEAINLPIWQNRSGKTFNITNIYSHTDTDDVVYTLNNRGAGTDMTDLSQIGVISIKDNGTDMYYKNLTSTDLSWSAVLSGDEIVLDNDAADDPGYITSTIEGYFQ